jgi:pseudouridine-5'-phosphate glycosidase
MPVQPNTQQYTVTQAQPILERTRLTVYAYIKSGKLPATLAIINGSTAYLVSHDDLMAFIAERDSKKNQRA